MAIAHAEATRNALADTINTQINAGTTNLTGALRVFEGATLIAEVPLEDPAMGAAVAGEASLLGTPLAANAVASTAAAGIDTFQLVDRDEATVLSGTVSESGGGGDLIIENVLVNSGQEVRILSGTYTASV